MINPVKYINNNDCKVMLPFTNSITENRAKGASHTVTNNGVSIRTLSSFSVPDCPNGATKAAYFDGSSYLTIPYSDDFDYFGDLPVTYQMWVYFLSFSSISLFASMQQDGNNFLAVRHLGSSTNKISILQRVSGTTYNIENNTTLLDTLNQWYLVEMTMSDSRLGVSNSYSYLDGFGEVDTAAEPSRITPMNAALNIGRFPDNSLYFNGYMSEFTIIKGMYRVRPRTFNPTQNIKYYSLPKTLK